MSAKVLFQIILGSTIVLSSITSSVKAAAADENAESRATKLAEAKAAAEIALASMAAIASSEAEVAAVEKMALEDMELARDATPEQRAIIDKVRLHRESITIDARKCANEAAQEVSRMLLSLESPEVLPSQKLLIANKAVSMVRTALDTIDKVKDELRRTHAAKARDAAPKVVIPLAGEVSAADLYRALAESAKTAKSAKS